MSAGHSPKGKPAARGRAQMPVQSAAEKAESSREIIGRLLARGITRTEAARRLGLTKQAVYRLYPVGEPAAVALAPVLAAPAAPVLVALPPVPAASVAHAPPPLVERDGHLIGFAYAHLPAPLSAEAEDARRSRGWCQRIGEADRIEEIAAGQCGQVKAGLLHLADLHRHHPRFYPEHHIPPSDLPVRYAPAPPAGIFGSIGQLCAEG